MIVFRPRAKRQRDSGISGARFALYSGRGSGIGPWRPAGVAAPAVPAVSRHDDLTEFVDDGGLRRGRAAWRLFAILTILMAAVGRSAWGQIPGLPAAPATAKGSPATKGASQAAAEKTKAAVATSTGPITVHRQVPDHEIQRFLTKFLPKYPGVATINVSVDEGVVTLEGRVDDDDTQNEITDVVKRVEGVRMVLNQTKTDEDVMTGWQFAERELDNLHHVLRAKWILILFALAIVAVSWLLARVFASHSETLLAPFVHNVLLRSVVGSIISSLLVIGGLVLALGELRLTQAVLSVLGVSGLVGLAVGFAFRDITENFIASVLLGLRRPFQIGDYVTVAGQSGVVKSLNTRATVLVTLEGKHVRIPNATIFKEIMVNATASPSYRTSFDVVIPYEASTAAAIDAIDRALRETNGMLSDPPPRALVEALEPGGVRLRADFWTPTRNIDWFQLMSDAKLRAKVALQQAGAIGSVRRRPGGHGRSQARWASRRERERCAVPAAGRDRSRSSGRRQSRPRRPGRPRRGRRRGRQRRDARGTRPPGARDPRQRRRHEPDQGRGVSRTVMHGDLSARIAKVPEPLLERHSPCTSRVRIRDSVPAFEGLHRGEFQRPFDHGPIHGMPSVVRRLAVSLAESLWAQRRASVR